MADPSCECSPSGDETKGNLGTEEKISLKFLGAQFGTLRKGHTTSLFGTLCMLVYCLC